MNSRGSLLSALLTTTVLGVLAASCKDQGVEQHQQALAKYAGCVERGAAPTDPCFVEVLALLDRVPKGSAARGRSDALRAGLRTAQQPKLRTPLAVQGGPHLPSEVTAQLTRCHRLAEQLGVASPAERAERLRALDECREKAERLDIQYVHGELDGGAG